MASYKPHDVDNSNISSPEKRLIYSRASSMSSSARSSDFEDTFHVDHFETGITTTRGEQFDQTTLLGDESNLQSPPTQTMERTLDGSGYRIPSYVFARNKSGNPKDWSVASNESLFSIQMGTSSFTRDQFNWLTKSGEFNGEAYKHLDSPHPVPEDLLASEDQISSVKAPASLSEPPSTTDVSNTGIPSSCTDPPTTDTKDPGVEPAAEPREGESEINTNLYSNDKPSPFEEQTHHSARGSDASVKSFAFPLLVGDLERGSSVKSGLAPQQKPQKQPQPQPPMQPSSSNTGGEVQAPAPDAAQSSSWFSSCFSCCSCRS